MLSVIIIAKNEAFNIRRCLESVQWADEVIVLDSGSEDDTVAIAKQYTDKVYTTDWQGYGIQKQRALSYASGDWVLNLDADESVSEQLKQAIQTKMASQQADAYRIPILMHFYGKPLRYSASPSRHIRLFKREGAQYSADLVHEKVQLPADARVQQVQEPIIHHSFRDVSHMLYKLNRYSSYSAQTRLEQAKTGRLSTTLLSVLWMFLRCYIFQRGFLDGKEGLLFAIYKAEGTFYRGIKQLYPDYSNRNGDIQPCSSIHK